MTVDALVIGAGLAGLAAAERLVAAGLHVRVLEARDRVGGRTWNRDVEGATVELGGAYVGPTQSAVHARVAALGLRLEPVFDEGDRVLTLGGDRWSWRTLPRMAPHRLVDFLHAKSRLDRLAASIPADAPWTASGAAALDARTAEDWLRSAVHSRAVRAAVRAALHTVLTTDPSDVSLLHLAWYVRCAGGFDALTDTTGGAQQDRIAGGSQVLAQRMAAGLPVSTAEPVTRVEVDADGVTVHTPAGRHRARRVICTAPPPLVARIDWSPALPTARAQLLQRLPMSAGIKVFAVYPDAFWRRRGLSGQAMTDGGPVQATFDSSPLSGRPGVLMGFVEGSHADRYTTLDPAARRDAVLAQLVGWFGPEAARPIRVDDHNWSDEPWSMGCLAHLPAGAWTRFGPLLRAPMGRVHWASAETATVWAGYMDGALRSGERAADEVIAAL